MLTGDRKDIHDPVLRDIQSADFTNKLNNFINSPLLKTFAEIPAAQPPVYGKDPEKKGKFIVKGLLQQHLQLFSF